MDVASRCCVGLWCWYGAAACLDLEVEMVLVVESLVAVVVWLVLSW